MIEPLTPREAEAVRLVAQGLADREIAEHMGISWKTAKSHVGQALQKTDTHNRVELTLWALRNGLVEWPMVQP